jgi:hypothetical protein
MAKIILFCLILLFHSKFLNGEDLNKSSEECSILNVFVDKLKLNPDNLLEILINEHQILTEDFVSLIDSNKGILERTIQTIKITNSKYYYLNRISKVINTVSKKESIHYIYSINEEGFNELKLKEEDNRHKLSKSQMDITIQFKINEGYSNSKWTDNKSYKFIGLFTSTTHFPFKFFD